MVNINKITGNYKNKSNSQISTPISMLYVIEKKFLYLKILY